MGFKEDQEVIKQIIQNICIGSCMKAVGYRVIGGRQLPVLRQHQMNTTIQMLLPSLTKYVDLVSFNDPETCVHLKKEYTGVRTPSWTSLSEAMTKYIKEYEGRSLPLKRIVPGIQFGHEYQAKKAAAGNNVYYGIIIAKKNVHTTVKQMYGAAISLIEGLHEGWGYVCTIHDPDVQCTLETTLWDTEENPDPEFNGGVITWQHGKKCMECKAKERSDTDNRKTVNMGAADCYKEEALLDMCPGVHLHLIVWSKPEMTGPVINQSHAYKTARQKFNVHMVGKSISAGAQAITYILSPPRMLMPATLDKIKYVRQNCSRMYLIQDSGNVIKEIANLHSAAGAMEMILNKHEKRAKIPKEITVTGLYPSDRKKQKEEQMFDMFLYVMRKYNINSMIEIPKLKKMMEKQEDPNVGALHTMTINAQRYKPTWMSALQHHIEESEKTTLQQYLTQYVETHGWGSHFDDAEKKEVMSISESETAFADILRRQGITNTLQWIDDIHNLFDKTTLNPKQNCICIYGESNAGKSWIIRPIQRACKNHTVIGGQMKQDNQFMFMNVPGKRWVLLNEITINDTSMEKFKELLGGERLEVEIKFMPPATLFRTPCIMTCNRHPYDDVSSSEDRKAFRTRIKMYRWNRINWEHVKWNGAGDLHPGVYLRKEKILKPQCREINMITAGDKTRAAAERMASAVHHQLRKNMKERVKPEYVSELTEIAIKGYMAFHHDYTATQREARAHMTHLTDFQGSEHNTTTCQDSICTMLAQTRYEIIKGPQEKRKLKFQTEEAQMKHKLQCTERMKGSDEESEETQAEEMPMSELLDLEFPDIDLTKLRAPRFTDDRTYPPNIIVPEDCLQSQPTEDEDIEFQATYEQMCKDLGLGTSEQEYTTDQPFTDTELLQACALIHDDTETQQ